MDTQKFAVLLFLVFVGAFLGTVIVLEKLTPEVDLTDEVQRVCLGVRSETQEIYMLEAC